jgi:mono/diheme cytochrome c family protein
MNIGKLFKIIAWLAAALVAIVLGVAGAVYFASNRKLAHLHTVDVRPVSIPTDAESIAHGKHLATTRGCTDCHDANLAGRAVVEDPAVGHLHAPNITRGRGGLPAEFSDLDYVRAIRHGLASDGRALVLMPSLDYEGMSDEDLGAMIAYLKSVPPVDRDRGPVSFGPVGRLLVLKGDIKLAAEHIDHAAVRPSAVVAEVSPGYGKYLSGSCIGCHHTNFSGGPIAGAPPDWPNATNLTPHASGAITGWTEENFLTAIRTQKRPDGTSLHPVMPAAFGQMTDLELKALWAYLRTLPPLATGTR